MDVFALNGHLSLRQHHDSSHSSIKVHDTVVFVCCRQCPAMQAGSWLMEMFPRTTQTQQCAVEAEAGYKTFSMFDFQGCSADQQIRGKVWDELVETRHVARSILKLLSAAPCT